MTTTSQTVFREQFAAMWAELAEVERRVGEDALLDEVLHQLDVAHPPLELRSTALVLKAIEEDLRPGGAHAWPGKPQTPERRRELAIIFLLDLFARELESICERLEAHVASVSTEPAI